MHVLTPLVEQIITDKFMPQLVDDVSVSDSGDSLLYCLPTKEGGLGISVIEEGCRMQYRASSTFTLPLTRKIILQESSVA